MLADYYKILGVKEDADQATIKRAWKRLADRYHPDKNIDKTGAERARAEEKFKEISNAYSNLSDPVKRAQYDSDRKAQESGATTSHTASTPQPRASMPLIAFGDVIPGSQYSTRVFVENAGGIPGHIDVSLSPPDNDIDIAIASASEDDPFPLTITLTLSCPRRSAIGAKNTSLFVLLDNVSLKIPVSYNIISGHIGFSGDDGAFDDSYDDVDIGDLDSDDSYIPGHAATGPAAPPTVDFDSTGMYSGGAGYGTMPTPAPMVSLADKPTPGWATFLGWLAFLVFSTVVGILLSQFTVTLQDTVARNLILSFGTLWQLCSGICVGIMTTGLIGGKRPRVERARRVFILSSIIFAAVGLVCLPLSFVPSKTTGPESGTELAPNSARIRVSLGFQNRDLTTQLLNASYPSNCFKEYSDLGMDRMIPLRNGQWDNGQVDPVKHAYFGIMENRITFADLTRDGRREAVVSTGCGIDASTETYSEVFVIDTSSPELNVLARLSPEDWGENSRGITWNTSDVQVANGYLLVNFRLGGSHAQPDWDATSEFTWDGSRFTKFGFEAHGEDGGSHPHGVINEGGNLHLSKPQLAVQDNEPSNYSGEQSSPGSTNNAGTQGASQSSGQSATLGGPTNDSQIANTTQSPSTPQVFTVPQWLTLAESQFENDNLKGALQSCNAALQIDPRDEDAIRLKEKIEDTMKILGSPATAQALSSPQGMTVSQWLALAESQFERNDFKGALQSCNAALQVDPHNSQAIQLKAKISATMNILGDT